MAHSGPTVGARLGYPRRWYGELFLSAYQALAVKAHSEDTPRWKLRPKFHYMAEQCISLTETFENPAKIDLKSFEDYLGKIKKIAKRCSSKTVSRTCLLRLRLAYACRWRKFRTLRRA